MLEVPTLCGGKVADAPLAQHGFSALVEIRKGSRVHRLLFDNGMTPAGRAGNLSRLGKDPAATEAIVCSHFVSMHPAQPPCTENIFIPGQCELAYRRVAWDRLTAPEAAV